MFLEGPILLLHRMNVMINLFFVFHSHLSPFLLNKCMHRKKTKYIWKEHCNCDDINERKAKRQIDSKTRSHEASFNELNKTTRLRALYFIQVLFRSQLLPSTLWHISILTSEVFSFSFQLNIERMRA